MYPPCFKVSVNCVSHGKDLDTEFKINLENDGVSDFDEVITFPQIIRKSATKVQPGKMVSAYMYYTYCNYMALYVRMYVAS